METLKLIGVLIIIVGFLLKLDTIAVVVIAGITTGLVAGLDLNSIVTTLGNAFVKTRYMSLFLLTLPVIGILERNGLKERAAKCIGEMSSITMGKVLSVYVTIRTIAIAFAVSLGGHVQFIRPLIYPMAEGAARKKYGELSEESKEKIKGNACAMENFGNFFGQNVFLANAGILLVVGTLQELGIKIVPLAAAKAAIPVAILSLVFSYIQNYLLGKKIEKIEGGRK